MNASSTTAEAACRAYRSIRDEDDHLAVQVYYAAHEAHLAAYAAGNAQGAALARASRRGLWPGRPQKKPKTPPKLFRSGADEGEDEDDYASGVRVT